MAQPSFWKTKVRAMPQDWAQFQYLLPILISLGLMIVGLVVGRIIQFRHVASIRRREAALRNVLVFNERRPPADLGAGTSSHLVVGSVVLSDDAFTVAYAALRSIFGGRIGVYESLMDRARREAVLRMKAEADKAGADLIFNVRFETSQITQNDRGSSLGALEVLCYGTALKVSRGAA